tara:strand:+ start:728 stop:973 length:246 start_codon:yes stop_codon:yes gene_type:complete
MAMSLQPSFRRYRYQGGGKKRVELKPEERVVYKLFTEVDLDTHRELKARAREAGVGSMRLAGQMIRKCLDDLEKVNGPIES